MAIRGHGGTMQRGRTAAAVIVVACLVLSLLPTATPAVAGTCRLRPSATDRARLRRMTDSRPRVVGGPRDLKRMRRLSRRNEVAGAARDRVLRRADALVGLSPQPYRRVGPRLQFHDYKKRITTLAIAYRIEPSRRYAAQARREMLTAARFRDWNPGHYLDTAEMTAATAMGYDWFHATLKPRARRIIRRAIVRKGLRTAKCFYKRGNGPVTRTNNWGIVTNAGMVMGAVAVADTHPRLAAAVLGRALRHVRPPLRRYYRDGSYAEGLGYWRYATEHAVKLTATLRTGFGGEFGLSQIGGFKRTGQFPLHGSGPTGKVANFGDTRQKLGAAPHLYWLARRFGRPVDAWQAAQQKPTPLHLLWFSPRTRNPSKAGKPRGARMIGTTYLRSEWGDPDAAYVAFKGGSNWVSHAHPELGSFIFDLHGRRWARDLGRDNYNLTGYFDVRRRHRWYRLSTPGQNTLTIAGMQQPHTASAQVLQSSRGRRRASTVLRLTKAYPAATAVRRGVALIGGDKLLVQDEIAARKRVSVAWAMHTKASVRISSNGRRAELTMGKRRVTARILRPANGSARFSVVSAQRSWPQASNTGVKRLQIRTRTGPKATKKSKSRLRLAVFLSPGEGKSTPRMKPLKRW